MTRRRLVAFVALVAIGMLAAAPAVAQRDDPLQSEQRKLRQTQQQLREEREKAARARARETSVLAELEQIDRRLGDKQREVTRLERQTRRVRGEIRTLRAEIERLEGRRSGQEEALARRLRAIYRVHAQGGALPIILSGDDPLARAVAVRHLVTLAALDARLIREYRGTSERLADKKGREETRQRDLAGLHADAQRERAEVDREAGRRRVLLAKIKDERAYHERLVGELTEASRRLETFIRDLQVKQRKLVRLPPPRPGVETPGVGFDKLRGRLPWPTEGRIITPFGAQVHPRFGTRTFRNGVDIEAAEGRDVVAVHPGHVVYTGWFKGYGNLIILDHGGEYYTLYAHIAEIEVKEGDDVREGQRIGTVGDTGSLAGPRLYFEVRYQSKPQDPADWLRQRG